jgi:hypothetical protein
MTGLTLTNNWVPVPKDILRKSASMGFSAQEQKVFWFIIERTLSFEEGKDTQTGNSALGKRLGRPFWTQSIWQMKRCWIGYSR